MTWKMRALIKCPVDRFLSELVGLEEIDCRVDWSDNIEVKPEEGGIYVTFLVPNSRYKQFVVRDNIHWLIKKQVI